MAPRRYKRCYNASASAKLVKCHSSRASDKSRQEVTLDGFTYMYIYIVFLSIISPLAETTKQRLARANHESSY